MIGPRFLDFDRDPATVARRLLGQRLVRIVDGERCAGIIVEVEAYLGGADRAAHSFGGRRTDRNRSMYLEGGHAYVFLVYGMHDCFNVVCGRADEGVAVLVRALEPTEGLPAMRARRPGATRDERLCAGPGCLARALAIDRRLDGVDLRRDPRIGIEQVRRRALPAGRIVVGPRIGVAYAGAWAAAPLRFHDARSPSVSGRPAETGAGRRRTAGASFF